MLVNLNHSDQDSVKVYKTSWIVGQLLLKEVIDLYLASESFKAKRLHPPLDHTANGPLEISINLQMCSQVITQH